METGGYLLQMLFATVVAASRNLLRFCAEIGSDSDFHVPFWVKGFFTTFLLKQGQTMALGN